jgi:diadenosine tetraphosphate (Ap4A) HIT family hydrolase
MGCGTCDRIRQRDDGTAPLWDSIIRSDQWDVVHAYDTSLIGWIVLVPRRHIDAVDELTESEGHELSDLIRNVSSFLKRSLGCEKTYIMQFAEHPLHPHVHFHVVPRMPDIPKENMGANIFNYLIVDEALRVSEEDMNQLAQKLRDELNG